MSATQEWLRKKFQEEARTARTTGDLYNEYSNSRLTKEVEDLKERLKKVETDMAYTQKIRFAQSPEEQKINDIRNID